MSQVAAFFAILSVTSAAGVDPVLEAVKTAYQANREAFAFGTIHFRSSMGTAGSLDKVLSGEWKPEDTAKGLYVYEDLRGRYECITDNIQKYLKPTSEGKPTDPGAVHSVRTVTDGKSTLYDLMRPNRNRGSWSYLSEIDSGVDRFYREAFAPLELGTPNPRIFCLSADIEMARDKPGMCRVLSLDERQKLGDVEALKLSLRLGESTVREYWVDLRRGAIPMLMTDAYGKDVTRSVVYTDIRHIEGKGWLPFRLTVFTKQGKSDGSVRDILIQKVDFERRPEKSMFRLEYPNPKPMVDSARMVQYAAQKVWDLDALPSLNSGRVTRLQQAPDLAGGALPGERSSGAINLTPLTVLGVLLLTTGGVTYRIFRHR